MELQTDADYLCNRCRNGLYFPGVEQPLLAPEMVLSRWPWSKGTTNSEGPYTKRYGQHRFNSDFRHADALPELAALKRTASKGCMFCCLLHSAILSIVATSPVVYDAIQVHLDYFWDADPKKNQAGSTVTRWVLQARLLLHDPNKAKRREGLPQDVEVSGWTSGSAIFWLLARKSGEHSIHIRKYKLMKRLSWDLYRREAWLEAGDAKPSLRGQPRTTLPRLSSI